MKWLRERSFHGKKERNYYENMNFCTKGKFILERRKEFIDFLN